MQHRALCHDDAITRCGNILLAPIQSRPVNHIAHERGAGRLFAAARADHQPVRQQPRQRAIGQAHGRDTNLNGSFRAWGRRSRIVQPVEKARLNIVIAGCHVALPSCLQSVVNHLQRRTSRKKLGAVQCFGGKSPPNAGAITVLADDLHGA